MSSTSWVLEIGPKIFGSWPFTCEEEIAESAGMDSEYVGGSPIVECTGDILTRLALLRLFLGYSVEELVFFCLSGRIWTRSGIHWIACPEDASGADREESCHGGYSFSRRDTGTYDRCTGSASQGERPTQWRLQCAHACPALSMHDLQKRPVQADNCLRAPNGENIAHLSTAPPQRPQPKSGDGPGSRASPGLLLQVRAGWRHLFQSAPFSPWLLADSGRRRRGGDSEGAGVAIGTRTAPGVGAPTVGSGRDPKSASLRRVRSSGKGGRPGWRCGAAARRVGGGGRRWGSALPAACRSWAHAGSAPSLRVRRASFVRIGRDRTARHPTLPPPERPSARYPRDWSAQSPLPSFSVPIAAFGKQPGFISKISPCRAWLVCWDPAVPERRVGLGCEGLSFCAWRERGGGRGQSILGWRRI
jgi:hypothetical protein